MLPWEVNIKIAEVWIRYTIWNTQKQPSSGIPKKGNLKICSKFAGEHPCRSAISKKLQSNFIEITLRHGCSTVNMLHIFRTPFLRTPLDSCFWIRHKCASILYSVYVYLYLLYIQLIPNWSVLILCLCEPSVWN